MKFSRLHTDFDSSHSYLQDTQVPEWKKAYIDYHSLKQYISVVKERQECEGQRYRSSLYHATPVPHVLQFPTLARNNKAGTSQYSPRHSLDFPRRTKGPPVWIKETAVIYYPDFPDASTSVSSQSKTLCVPMNELPPKVNQAEVEFLAKLDEALERVDRFYLNREKEVQDRLAELKRQLQENRDHQRFSQWLGNKERRSRFPLKFITSQPRSDSPPIITRDGRFGTMESRRARKKLQKAMVEHYKKLDALQNFRTLNLVGFQKVLKKWEKVTHMAIQDAYTKEKIDPSGFSSTKLLAELTRDTEELYTTHFASGNKKRALSRLRAGWAQKTHYFSTFRSGVYLGLAVPALISGVYQTFQQSTRDEIGVWDGLLVVYATIFIPVLFALLVSINILVWTKVRINHVFIFGLDVKSKLDHQKYAEVPAILMSTLCYSFWLSFNRIGSHIIRPTTWPLIWLGFNTFILCNPLPMLHRSSRVWLIKKFARLLTTGFTRVEFTDFWMGDQICSLNFSLTNLFFIGCVYSSGFGPDSNQQCGSRGPHLAAHIILSVSPFFCRFVQSLRRWRDSRSKSHPINAINSYTPDVSHLTDANNHYNPDMSHLINAGKYVTGMFMYLFYYYWRFKGNSTALAMYILAAVVYNVYACVWDYLTDWSLLRPHSKYPLLRDEVLYSDHLSFYYFAIISNLVIRFSWTMYLPSRGLPSELRSFIVAMLEMLRRWQWNFLRLENEHLGNIDQYRATLDVLLPYAFDSSAKDSDAEDWDQPYETKKHWAARIFTS